MSRRARSRRDKRAPIAWIKPTREAGSAWMNCWAAAPEETDVNRIAIAEAGVRRCFARRHEGRYAFMPHEDAVRHCRKWIAALRDMRVENENRRV